MSGRDPAFGHVREGQLHRDLIAEYVSRHPDCETRGFRRTVLGLLKEGLPDEGEDFEDHDFRYLTIIPDAFRVTKDAVVVVEAQVTSDVKGPKLDQLVGLFWDLDMICTELELHLVDRNGAVFAVDMVDLAYRYIDTEVPSDFGRLKGKFIEGTGVSP